jgi:Ca2+-binding RTX toxin-like protein
MAGDVTVLGGAGKTFTLHFDTTTNAQLASVLASNISAGVLDHSISASNDSTPSLSGTIGEFVDTHTPVAHLPPGYDAVVNVNKNATIFGSGGNSESVLSGASNLTFIATGGSGTVVAGAGSLDKGHQGHHQGNQGHKDGQGGVGGNKIVVPTGDNGNWLIETGGGNDSISAQGGGNDTIGAGAGHNVIRLGSGDDLVQSSGNDTIYAGNGAETVQATQGSKDLIFAGDSSLTYVGGSGSATIVGGTGPDEIHGGSGGKNSIVAGSGNATLFGGGDGDQFSGGSGNDTFVAARGASTMTAGTGHDTFVFSSASSGGNGLISNFRQGLDQVLLQGYGSKAVTDMVTSQTHPTASSTLLTLGDGTQITFSDVSNIKLTDLKSG